MSEFRKMKLIAFFGLLLVVGACIDPFTINLGNQMILVVDGLITDQPGPYTVKLSESLSLDDQLDERNWVHGAAVTIFDDQGNSENLVEPTTGNYQTKTFQGVIGRSYYIKITTPGGSNYTSTPEKLIPVADFSNLRFEFVQKESVLTNDPLNSKNGFEIYLDASVLPEQNGLARWRWTGTFEILAYPSLKVKAVSTRTGGTAILPDPPFCSGYIVRGSTIVQIDTCSCCNCWITQYNDAPLLSDQRFIDNDQLSNVNIAFVQANRRYLYNKYYLVVEQMSATPTAYNFWQKVQQQQQSGSDLFQTPPAATGGNITTTTPKALVTGLFTAASIKQHTIIIDRNELPAGYFLPSIDTIRASCATIYPNSSTVKPPFY